MLKIGGITSISMTCFQGSVLSALILNTGANNYDSRILRTILNNREMFYVYMTFHYSNASKLEPFQLLISK